MFWYQCPLADVRWRAPVKAVPHDHWAACPIVRAQDATRDKTQRDRFVQRKNASGGSTLSNIPPESIRSIAVFKTNDGDGVISVNGVPIRMSSHVYGPLELE